MAEIRVLDPHVIDHIAAGEVVERPASVVKELLENALDAGAIAVEIALVDGGLTSITLTDDGHGMTPENARRCVLRHATSKLRGPEDLFKIATLGFRGEALSSIAAVSELTLTTRPTAALEGFSLRLRAGQVEAEEAAGCPAGTTLVVRDLFFNTPARRKFMRAPATEQAHVLEAVTRVMLASRRGGVLVRNGARRLVDIHHEATGAERVLAALGARVGTLYPLQATVDGVAVDGFMSAPEIDRGDAKGLWLFVNGRFVRDRLLQRAVVDTCRELLQPGRYPTVVLHLQLPPDQVDVNVHPQKLEVRFAHGATVYRAVACALAAVVAQKPWGARPTVRSSARGPGRGDSARVPGPPGGAAGAAHGVPAGLLGGGLASAGVPGPPEGAAGVAHGVPAGSLGGGLASAGSQGSVGGATSWSAGLIGGSAGSGPQSAALAGRGLGRSLLARPSALGSSAGLAASAVSSPGGMSEGPCTQQPGVGSAPFGPNLGGVPSAVGEPQAAGGIRLLGSVLERYFVGAGPLGLVLVDWPALAAHQALEQLRAEAQDAEGVRRTALLLPEVFDAQGPWAAWLETAWEGLTRYGFELEPVAPGRYAVRAVPEALVGAPPLAVAWACVSAAYAGRQGATAADHPAADVLARCAEQLRALPPLDVAQAVLADEVPPRGVAHIDAAALERLVRSGV